MNNIRLKELYYETQRLHTDAHNFAISAIKARRSARLDSGHYEKETIQEESTRIRKQQEAIQRAHRYTHLAELYRIRLIQAKRELQQAIISYRQSSRDNRQSFPQWDV